MIIDILSRKRGNRLKSYRDEMRLLWSISKSNITNVFRSDNAHSNSELYYITQTDENNFNIVIDFSFYDILTVTEINVKDLSNRTTEINFSTVCPFKKYLLKKSKAKLKDFDIDDFEITSDVESKLNDVFRSISRDLKIKSLLN
jgi:hypothetical protein